MIVQNTTDKEIKNATFGGYEFTIPAKSICAIWEPVGKHLTTKIYRKEASSMEDGSGIQPLLEVDASEWDGKTYAQVTRFKIDYTRIPNRNDLIRIAKQRGVNKEFLEKCQEDGSVIENQDIADEINKLPVPEDVRLPEVEMPEKEEESSE